MQLWRPEYAVIWAETVITACFAGPEFFALCRFLLVSVTLANFDEISAAILTDGPGRNARPAFQRRRREESADEAVVAPRLWRRGGADPGRRRESHDTAPRPTARPSRRNCLLRVGLLPRPANFGRTAGPEAPRVRRRIPGHLVHGPRRRRRVADRQELALAQLAARVRPPRVPFLGRRRGRYLRGRRGPTHDARAVRWSFLDGRRAQQPLLEGLQKRPLRSKGHVPRGPALRVFIIIVHAPADLLLVVADLLHWRGRPA